MSLGWRFGYLDEHSHSPLLVYSAVCYLRGIAHCFSQLHYIYAYLSWIWILSYGTWVSSRGFIWEMVKHWISPLLCWLSLGDSFIFGHIPWFRNGFMSLIFLWEAYIHDFLYGMVWVLLWLLVGVLWRRSYLHSLHLEVCVEGHDTGYDLHGFSYSWLSSWMFSFTYIGFEIG